MSTHEGGCVCGAIRYEVEGEPQMAVHCFCTHCQATSGGQMSTNLVFENDKVRVTRGELAHCFTTGDTGGKVKREFCGDCGSPIFSTPEVMGPVTIVKPGGLDEKDWFSPNMCIFTDSAPPWAQIPEGLQCFPGMPG